MIYYLESIIKCSINLAANNLNIQRKNLAPPSVKESESDSSFMISLLLVVWKMGRVWVEILTQPNGLGSNSNPTQWAGLKKTPP
jgi:hypothetical protein